VGDGEDPQMLTRPVSEFGTCLSLCHGCAMAAPVRRQRRPARRQTPCSEVVETMGFEPTTPCLQSRCSNQLSYVPVDCSSSGNATGQRACDGRMRQDAPSRWAVGSGRGARHCRAGVRSSRWWSLVGTAGTGLLRRRPPAGATGLGARDDRSGIGGSRAPTRTAPRESGRTGARRATSPSIGRSLGGSAARPRSAGKALAGLRRAVPERLFRHREPRRQEDLAASGSLPQVPGTPPALLPPARSLRNSAMPFPLHQERRTTDRTDGL
jgi:hypothetical protein